MAAKKKNDSAAEEKKQQQEIPEQEQPSEAAAEPEKAPEPQQDANDKYLRLLAEYDNYRKRSVKERDSIYTDVRMETVKKFLPVYDNLERALAVQTADEAFRRGVEMTFNQLCEVMGKLGVEPIEAVGKPFDPTMHNAVMHVQDEALGESTVVEEFQKGFRIGDRVIRFSMVKVAN